MYDGIDEREPQPLFGRKWSRTWVLNCDELLIAHTRSPRVGYPLEACLMGMQPVQHAQNAELTERRIQRRLIGVVSKEKLSEWRLVCHEHHTPPPALQEYCGAPANILQAPRAKMPAMQTTSSTHAIDLFLDGVLGEHAGPSAWAEQALLDAVVPGWRFSVTGAANIRRQFRAWFHDPGTFEELRRLPIPNGEVVELTVTWIENGVPNAARQVHVLELDVEGKIARDKMWCGGRWPASLLAEMQAASDAS